MAWISAWDTDGDAAEITAALEKSATCWRDNALGVSKGDLAIGASFRVDRHGRLVAFLRGFPEALRAGMDTRLFSLVGPEPKAIPLTDLRIPARVRLPEPVPGHLDGDVYENGWLGVVGRVPAGMYAEAGGRVDLMVHRPNVVVHGALVVSTRITTDEQNEKTFREVGEGFAEEVRKLNGFLMAEGSQTVQTSLGNGIERTFRVVNTTLALRAVLVPICAGTGSIVFIEAYEDPYARSVLDGWMSSFRWTQGRNVTACDFLDPK